MAYNATLVWEVRFGGSDTACGGGFDPSYGGTDYSVQDTAQATGTASSATTTVTATTGIFTAAMVGNVITDGTTYKVITAFTSSTVVTVDSAPSWTSATVYVGGGLASIGKAAGLKILGNVVYIKYNATPYTISSTTPNVTGGIVNYTTNGSDSVADYWIGYDTTRSLVNAPANKPMLQVASSGVTSVTVFKIAPASTLAIAFVRNLIVDGQSKSAIRGFDTVGGSTGIQFSACSALNCTNSGFSATSGRTFLSRCYTTGCSTAASFSITSPSVAVGCRASGNSTIGFSVSGMAIDCISDGNSGANSDGFQLGAGNTGVMLIGCIAYNNGRHGFNNTSNNSRGFTTRASIATGNAGYGFNNGGTSVMITSNCAADGSNTSGQTNGMTENVNFYSLSADPFTNAAGGDFNLNNVAGGGATLRAVAVDVPG